MILRLTLPPSHIRLYSHGDEVTWPPVGKPVRGPDGKWCSMASSGDNISEAKFLTIAEVAAQMRVSKMTVYRLVHSGDLPAVRVGRSVRVPESDVHAYLERSFYDAG